MMMMMKCMPNEEMDRDNSHTLQLQAFRARQYLRVAQYQVTTRHYGTILESREFKNCTEKDGYYM